ncbi:methyltransferase domain-containing protein [Desulforhopalus vacuolatus]|uniref:methyltransferase domain-containing protein n=1 Tax=Desulforhopalus vacuolatus TaxID=40414 RepID=UPI0019650FE1|nr:methyltransferase domain-containing protein [Desulforhopalus vacuolatus]MBM9520068.1 methyltransferase domain-containing protein [Desulforhopalus vacuolatus]
MSRKPSQTAPVPDKALIASSFAASLSTYEKHAGVQLALAQKLLEMVCEYTDDVSWGRVLEVGCGTGWLAERLVASRMPEHLYLNDIASELCTYAVQRLHAAPCLVESLAGDIETLELPEKLQLVLSSSTLQWIEDLPTLFEHVYQSLLPGGIMAFSIFAPGTMGEITALSGRGLHYFHRPQLSAMLKDFTILAEETVRQRSYFPSLLALFRHIRNTGVGGLSRVHWTRASLSRFEKQYRDQFGTAEGLPVTWRAHFFVVEKSKGYLDEKSICCIGHRH